MVGVQRAKPAGRSPQGAEHFSASEARGGEANLPVEGLTGNPQEGVPLFYEGLEKIDGVILYNRPQLPVLSFGIEGMSGEAVTEALAQKGFALRGGFHCSPLAHQTMGTYESGTARIGIGAFNTREQAAALLRAVAAASCRQRGAVADP